MPFAALEAALSSRKSPLPWLVTAVVGAAGVVAGIGAFAWHLAPAVRGRIEWSGWLLFGVCVAAVITWICVRLTARIVFRKRIERFALRYVPAFVKFCEQSTPMLVQRLGSLPQKGTT